MTGNKENEKRKSYSPELHYFFRSPEFKEKNYQKAVRVIAKTVAPWCEYYSARLLAPKKGVKELQKEGKLPAGKKEKETFLETVLDWIFENSCLDDSFSLFLGDEQAIADKHPARPIKLDHPDDTCCWILNLTEQEFKQLQKELQKNELPEDLFYESSLGKCIPKKPKTLMGKLLQRLGFESYQCYTPKEWEMKK